MLSQKFSSEKKIVQFSNQNDDSEANQSDQSLEIMNSDDDASSQNSLDNSEDILFQGLRDKCKNGFFNTQKKLKTCLDIRKEMQAQMGELAYKYCFIVYCGMDDEKCWGINTDLQDKKYYFKVSHQCYTYVVYLIKQQVNMIEQENQQVQSSQEFEKVIKQIQQPNNKIRGSAQSECKKQKVIERRKSCMATIKPIIIQQSQQQQKLKPDFTKDKLPTKDQIEQIAKQYKKYIGRYIPTKEWTCQQYVDAILQSFKKNASIVPKLILVKQQPQGDQFWDYVCENEGSIHTWDLIQDKGVGICI